MATDLAGGQIESLADLLREFNHHNGLTVAYKAYYNPCGHRRASHDAAVSVIAMP